MKHKAHLTSLVAAFPALLFAGFLSSCDTEAEAIGGETDCYGVVTGGTSVSGGLVTVDGVTANVKDGEARVMATW